MVLRLKKVIWRLNSWRLFGQWRVHVYGRFSATNPENIRIGSNVAINPEVFLVARCGITIGDNVVLSARCMIIDAGLDLNFSMAASNRSHFASPIVIEDGAWIGAGAIILAGVTVGRNAVVGAGSVVVKDVPQFHRRRKPG